MGIECIFAIFRAEGIKLLTISIMRSLLSWSYTLPDIKHIICSDLNEQAIGKNQFSKYSRHYLTLH